MGWEACRGGDVVQVHVAGERPTQSLSGVLQGVMPMILQMQQQLLG